MAHTSAVLDVRQTVVVVDGGGVAVVVEYFYLTVTRQRQTLTFG